MADFNINIRINPAPAVAGTKQVSGALTGLENQAKALQRVLMHTFGVYAGAAAVSQSIRLLANFSQEMSTVQAVSGASAEEFERLREEAKRLGITTRFTATQAAEGMTYLARSGFTVGQTLNATEGTLRLAQAGAFDLGRAADITSNILRSFGMATANTGHLVDVLALAANRSNADVDELGQAMKFVSPSAAGMNVSLETTVAALEALHNAGLKANMAGTGLRRVLSGLEAPTAAQRKALAAYGIETEEVRITNVGLTKALQRLKDANLTAGESLNLFGQRGGPAAQVMMNMIELIREFEDENYKADGTSKEFADTMDRNLNGALLRVKSAFQGLIIEFGELGPESGLTKFLNDTASVVRWLAAHMDQLGTAVTLAGIALGVAFYQKGLLLADKGLAFLIGKIKLLSAAAVANPFNAWIVAITAVLALLTMFSDQITMGVGNMVTLADVGTAAFQLISEGLGVLFGRVETGTDGATKKTNEFGGTVGLVFGAIFRTVAQVVDKTLGLIMGLIGAIVAAFATLPKAIADIFIRAINGILRVTEWGVNQLLSGLNTLPGIDVQLVDFGELENNYATGAYQLGVTVKDVFLEGFNQSVVQDALTATMDRAEQLALERLDKQHKPGGDTPTSMSGVNAPPRITDGRGREKQLPTYRELLKNILRETELLKLNSRERFIANGLYEMEDQLKRKLSLTKKVLASVALSELYAEQARSETLQSIIGPMEDLQRREQALIDLRDRGSISAKQYAEEMEKVRLGMLEINDPAAYEAFQRQKSLLEEIKAPMQDYLNMEADLNELIRQKKISQEEYNKTLDDARLAMLQATNTEGAGFEAGLIRIKQSIEGVGTIIENGLVNAFQGAEDALVDFVTTGEADFGKFVDSILADLTRLLLRQTLFSLLGFNVPGGAGGGGGAQGFATGGSFMVGGAGGTDRTPVSFLATKGERVTVETPSQQKASADGNSSVNVPVKIVNVLPNEVTEEMNSSEGERVILNVITRNRSTVKGVIAS